MLEKELAGHYSHEHCDTWEVRLGFIVGLS